MTNRRQIRSNRFLPPYVTRFVDRHGKERLRFRRKGYPSRYFASALGTEEFRQEYTAFNSATAIADDLAARTLARTVPGSIGDLFARYAAVPDRLGPTKTTQDRVRSILERFTEGREDRPVAAVTFEHLDAIIARRRVKRKAEKGYEGGIEAARKLRKELVRLFDFAVKIRFIPTNPARQTERVKVAPAERSGGFHTWTEDEIAQFRAHHALGTKPRLAMELMLWTDQRKIDSIHLGPQHIRNGCFEIRQTKTGKTLRIPIAAQLRQAIDAMPRSDALCFLVTAYGRPFTVKGFGGWFRAHCDAAGLTRCTAHGLRKATMRRMAELNMGNQTMKAMSGHSRDDEVARYTAEANQESMAHTAVQELSRWEVSNLRSGLDTNSKQGDANAG